MDLLFRAKYGFYAIDWWAADRFWSFEFDQPIGIKLRHATMLEF